MTTTRYIAGLGFVCFVVMLVGAVFGSLPWWAPIVAPLGFSGTVGGAIYIMDPKGWSDPLL